MLDRSRADASSPRARAVAYLVASALSLAGAIWLSITGIDYVINGCACDEALFPRSYAIAALALAAGLYTAGVALAAHALRLLTHRGARRE
jgi:hypothetical protein